jgi:hypothetical protein
MPEFGDVRQPSPDSGDTMPDSVQASQNLAGVAESPAIWPGYWADPAWIRPERLNPTSPAGILPEQQDPSQLARIWPGWPASGQLARIRHKWPDSGHVRQKLYEKYFFIILY